MRDSKDPASPVLAVGPAEWSALLTGIRQAHARPHREFNVTRNCGKHCSAWLPFRTGMVVNVAATTLPSQWKGLDCPVRVDYDRQTDH